MRSIGGLVLEQWTHQMGTQHNTWHIRTTYCPKRQLPPRYVMPLQRHNFVSIAHRNSRRVPLQHQHLRATLESYLNARNVMAKELQRKLYPLDHDPLH